MRLLPLLCSLILNSLWWKHCHPNLSNPLNIHSCWPHPHYTQYQGRVTWVSRNYLLRRSKKRGREVNAGFVLISELGVLSVGLSPKLKKKKKKRRHIDLAKDDENRSPVPSFMKRRSTLDVSSDGQLKVKRRTIIHTSQSLNKRARKDDERWYWTSTMLQSKRSTRKKSPNKMLEKLHDKLWSTTRWQWASNHQRLEVSTTTLETMLRLKRSLVPGPQKQKLSMTQKNEIKMSVEFIIRKGGSSKN